MHQKTQTCAMCGQTEKLTNLYGYTVCEDCKADLKLFTDKTIRSHFPSKKYPDKASYEKEIDSRLAFIDEDYTKKKIKLLHVKDRLKTIN